MIQNVGKINTCYSWTFLVASFAFDSMLEINAISFFVDIAYVLTKVMKYPVDICQSWGLNELLSLVMFESALISCQIIILCLKTEDNKYQSHQSVNVQSSLSIRKGFGGWLNRDSKQWISRIVVLDENHGYD